jgi:CubicO group peptidase (beta-lactamase class C family)
MIKINLLLLLSICSLVCFGQHKNHTQQLDSIFATLHAQHQFNGSVLIAEKGKVILEKGYGYRNEQTKALNTAQTIFELASCSKQFTATAIVLLKREGKLDYKDPISKYLPELGFWNKVTIADLLRHTSGLPEFLADMDNNQDSTKIATNADVIRFYAQRKDTLRFEPGSRHRYCNTNYVLLASIVERLSGKPFAGFLQQRIFKPLHMDHTFIYNRKQQPRAIKNIATGYAWATGSFRKISSDQRESGDYFVRTVDGVTGTAKVNSTVGDIYKWITALKNNTFLTKSEFEEMTAVTQTSSGQDIPYGFGFMLSKGANRFSFGHNGSWDGFATLIFHNMLKDRTVIILQNFKMGAFPYNNIVQVLEDSPQEIEFHKKITLPSATLQQYTGVYQTADTSAGAEAHSITYLDGHLIYNTTRNTWDMRFYPISETKFQGIRQASNDSYLQFTPMENGDLKLELLQGGKVIDSGIRKK